MATPAPAAPPLPAFNFSGLYGSVLPLVQALSARYPELLDLQLQQARKAPQRSDIAFSEWQKNQQGARTNAAMDTRSRISAGMAAQALARQQMTDQENATDYEHGRETELKNAMYGRAAGLAQRYGGGPPENNGSTVEALLAGRGQAGGASYRGPAYDDTNAASTAAASSSWNAQICRQNPMAPGCPGTAAPG